MEQLGDVRVARHLMVRVLRLLSNLQCDSARQCNVLAVSRVRDDVLRVRSEIRPCFVDEVTSAGVGGGIVCAMTTPIR